MGYSRGNCLDSYSDRRIKAINSQMNEQAKSGLQRIRGQLAYMHVNNFKLHCALFLALQNMNKVAVQLLHKLPKAKVQSGEQKAKTSSARSQTNPKANPAVNRQYSCLWRTHTHVTGVARHITGSSA